MPKNVCDEGWIATAQRELGLDVSDENDVSEHESEPEDQPIIWGLYSDERDSPSWPRAPSFYKSELQRDTPGPDIPPLKPTLSRQCLFGSGCFTYFF